MKMKMKNEKKRNDRKKEKRKKTLKKNTPLRRPTTFSKSRPSDNFVKLRLGLLRDDLPEIVPVDRALVEVDPAPNSRVPDLVGRRSERRVVARREPFRRCVCREKHVVAPEKVLEHLA